MAQNFYFFVNNNNYVAPLSIKQYGMEQCLPEHDFGPAVRDFYLLHYVVSGSGVFRTAKQEYKLSANSTFVIRPDETTYYRADSQEPWLYYWVGFSGTEAERIMGTEGFDKDNPIITEDKNYIIKRSIISLVHECKTYGHNPALALSWLYRIFYGISISRPRTTRSAQSEHLSPALKFIADNYANDITVEDIAKHVYLNRSYLYKLFVRELSTTPINYLIDYRINRAAQLLEHSGHNVTDIAMMTGFKSPALFCRMFKKLTGKTPLQHRRQSLKTGLVNALSDEQ